MSKYYLYHICKVEDIGNYEEGYIGITKREPSARWSEHRKTKDWWTVHGEENISCKVIQEGDARFIKDLEEKYRPVQGIGWNKNAGGCELAFGHPAAKYARYGKKKKKKKK